jgi:hypothetical protein
VFLEQGLRLKQIISIAIVECQRDGAARQSSLLQRLAQFRDRDHCHLPFQHRELFVEIVWLDTQIPRIARHNGHAVVHQDYHLGAEASSPAPQGGPDVAETRQSKSRDRGHALLEPENQKQQQTTE